VGGIERVERGLCLRLEGRNESTLEVAFLMLAVGREPEDAILAPGLRAPLDAGEGIDGLYLAGDVRRGPMRQVGIAVGDGLAAAMDSVRSRAGRDGPRDAGPPPPSDTPRGEAGPEGPWKGMQR